MDRSAKLKSVAEFVEDRFRCEIKAHSVLETVAAKTSPIPPSLHPGLATTLQNQGISTLYSHQAEAFTSISQNQDTLIVSKTASGKTLSFMLPVLNEYLNSPMPFTVLLLYPTKALSRDQEGTLGRLMQTAVKQSKFGTFDGDTPQEERTALQRSADFIITNPDMLHSGILPNHTRRWREFLARLRYIIIDEVHTYRGAYGSHVANVFRRLLRICDLHGSKPTFICSSATIGNPREHAELLVGRSFSLIERDGAPRPKRDLYFINPPIVRGDNDSYYRKGPGAITIPLLRKAAESGVRTICFCKSRQQVERLHRAVTDGYPKLRSLVKPYRGGLLPNERRQLERDLFSGNINTIISTNALELGIDIGDLDLCVLTGHPGTAASFWQQAGRVGRTGHGAMIVYVARNSPVDQYLVNNSQFITNASLEYAWLNADNPYIFLQHLSCIAQEHPVGEQEPRFDHHLLAESISTLENSGLLKPYKGSYRYAGEHFPSRGVNLRGMTDFNIDIYCGTEVIGEIDPIGARGELYKDAIYQHLGGRYMSLDLDLEKKLCRVVPVDVDYYTEAVWESRVEMTYLQEEKAVFSSQLKYGDIYVNRQPKLYKKIRERSYENIGYGPITLSPFEYETSGFSLHPSEAWQKALSKVDRRYIGAALYGFSYLIRRAAPAVCMGDMRDINTDVVLAYATKNWESALFLYDSMEGGVGFSEKIFERFSDALELCRSIIDQCGCPLGCPACVPPLPPGIEEDDLQELLVETNAAIACTKSLLELLQTGVTVLPKVTIERRSIPPANTPPAVNEDLLRLRSRLNRASGIIDRKRAREH